MTTTHQTPKPIPPWKIAWRALRSGGCAARRRAGIEWDRLAANFRRADISIFHEFAPPPTGGGHQFLRALWAEWEGRGFRLENNTISRATRACLFNSFNFDMDRLRRLRRPGCRMVHRVDGPIGAYRGGDDAVDRRIWQANRELADATIFQSRYSLERHLEQGMEFVAPVVILNAADPRIFHPPAQRRDPRGRKIRLISTSWSDNPNKGAIDCRALEEQLDWERFDYTFVGRAPVAFRRIRTLPPVPSSEMAELLRDHDIYVATSRLDPCSNALIEALACGLPAIYLNSGGHPEIVGEAGFGYDDPREIPALLERLVAEYEARRSRIRIPALIDVAMRYLEVMGIENRDFPRSGPDSMNENR